MKHWKPKTAATTCIRCKNYFEYLQKTPNNKRNVCDDCRSQNLELSKWPNSSGLGNAAKATHREIAEILNIAHKEVQRYERQALQKLREHPQLVELFGIWKSEGAATGEWFGSPSGDAGKMLLEYQLAVADWWAIRDSLADNKICEKEAMECLKWIEDFQKKIVETLERLKNGTGKAVKKGREQ